MYSFSKDLLSTYWRPGTVPELGAAMNKIRRVSLRGVYTLVHVFGAARTKQATNQYAPKRVTRVMQRIKSG